MIKGNRIECFAVFAMSALCAAMQVVAAETNEVTAPVSAAESVTGASGASVMIEDFEAELKKAPDVNMGWECNGGQFSTASLTRVGDAKDGIGAGQIGFEV